MNKNAAGYIVISVILFCIADAILLVRYSTWGNSADKLTAFAFFVFLAECIALVSVLKYKQIFNPFSIYSFFILIFGFSFIQLSERQQPYSFYFIVIVILSIVFFLSGAVLGSVIPAKSVKNVIPKLNHSLRSLFICFLLICGIIAFSIEIKQLGYVPILNLNNPSVYGDITENQFTPLHNFVVLCSLLPVMFFIQLKKKKMPLWLVIIATILCIFITLNFFSRQIIILFLFAIFLAFNYHKRISPFKLIIFSAFCIVSFVLLGELRGAGQTETGFSAINDFLKTYAEIDKPTHLLETYLNLYGAINFSTADRILTSAIQDTYVSFGTYAFRPIISILPVDKESWYPAQFSSYTQLGTYVTDPFLDFRLFGTVIINMGYGYFSMNSFKNYSNAKSEYYILEWSIIAFCLFMLSFTNYFNLFFVFFLLIINRLAIK